MIEVNGIQVIGKGLKFGQGNVSPNTGRQEQKVYM